MSTRPILIEQLQSIGWLCTFAHIFANCTPKSPSNILPKMGPTHIIYGHPTDSICTHSYNWLAPNTLCLSPSFFTITTFPMIPGDWGETAMSPWSDTNRLFANCKHLWCLCLIYNKNPKLPKIIKFQRI